MTKERLVRLSRAARGMSLWAPDTNETSRNTCNWRVPWNPAITKCHGTEKNVRYSGVFVIAKTTL